MIETAVLGDHVSCRRRGDELAQAARRVDHVVEALEASIRRTEDWDGLARASFRTRVRLIGEKAVDTRDRLLRTSDALETFASGLAEIERRMAAARSQARSAGLTVVETVVHEPPPRPAAATPGVLGLAMPSPDRLAYVQVGRLVAEGRAAEREVHGALHSELASVRNDGFLVETMRYLGLAHGDHAGAESVALWAGTFALARLDDTASVWASFVLGRAKWFADTSRWARLQRAARGIDPVQAKPHQRARRLRMTFDSRLAGRVGAGVGGVLGAWEQWQTDADDPTKDEGEKAVRAVARGGVVAGGGAAGAVAGAAAGAALGSVVPVLGTAAGGIIGGALGGAVGSGFADKAADAVLNEGKDVLGGVGDALTFWD